MIINSNTKIGAIIKFHPNALETIISIHPTFEKLRNPFLRKVMAGRTSISTASKISKCSVEDFFTKLEPLGYIIDRQKTTLDNKIKNKPEYLASINKEDTISLDVRPILQGGTDPLGEIMDQLKRIQPSQTLKIINTFEPTPLIKLLEKKGYVSYSNQIDEETIETFFHKKTGAYALPKRHEPTNSNDWDATILKYKNNTIYLDVQELEMPLPMIKIMEAIDILSEQNALYVYHKRIPVFLLPELMEKGITYQIKEIDANEVHLLLSKE